MDVKEKIAGLEKKRLAIENKVASLQQNLANLNRDYLILLGQIEAYKKILENIGDEIMLKV
jgi:hypothetical protein